MRCRICYRTWHSRAFGQPAGSAESSWPTWESLCSWALVWPFHYISSAPMRIENFSYYWYKELSHVINVNPRDKGSHHVFFNKGHFMLELKGPWPWANIQIMWLAEKLETVQVHFPLDLESHEGPKKLKWMKFPWCPTWQQVDNVSWSTGYCNRSIKKRWV